MRLGDVRRSCSKVVHSTGRREGNGPLEGRGVGRVTFEQDLRSCRCSVFVCKQPPTFLLSLASTVRKLSRTSDRWSKSATTMMERPKKTVSKLSRSGSLSTHIFSYSV